MGLHRSKLSRRIPHECFVDIMKFLNRDSLEVLELVSTTHLFIVDKYFDAFPLRRVERCMLNSTRSGDMRVHLICRGRAIETNSDLYFWLRHCFVECLEFIEFKFTPGVLSNLQRIGEENFGLNYCVFDYHKRSSSKYISHHEIDLLFSTRAFQECHGAVFSFSRPCVFRPLILNLLELPPKSMVIDFEFYEATTNDYEVISNWLNGFCSEWCEPKALFLKGFVYSDGSLNLIETLQNDFVNSTTKQSYVLNIECDDDMELKREKGNGLTGEKFEVNTTTDGVVCVRRG